MSDPSRYLTHDVPPSGGRVRVVPEDFEVEEVPAYEPSGEGEHLFLWVEKRERDTQAVVRALSRALGISEREVGYAGLKDRQAVTRQTFSVPARLEQAVAQLELPGARIVWARRHRNKLRTGHLRGNRFRIRIREVQDVGAAQAAFARLSVQGLPNFFGVQRFGRRGDNAEQGFALLRAERLPTRPDRFLRRLLLSAAQSALFNQALADRLAAGTWATALAGDVLRKSDSGGVFVCREPEVDQPRVERFEVSPAGPIFGPKMVQAEGAVRQAEEALLGAHRLGAAHFERQGGETQGTRRPYRIRLETPSLEVEGDHVIAAFELPPGSYATVVLGELIKGGAALDGTEGEGAGDVPALSAR